MAKKKVLLEYVLRSKSRKTIWNMVGTAYGLSRWFADKVEEHEDRLLFSWAKLEVREARIVCQEPGERLVLEWTDDEELGCRMELRLIQDELTRDYTLLVSDEADEDEVDELQRLLESQVCTLFRVSGI